jgi:hypothetical protein
MQSLSGLPSAAGFDYRAFLPFVGSSFRDES